MTAQPYGVELFVEFITCQINRKIISARNLLEVFGIILQE